MSGKSRLVYYASDAIALVALRTAEPTHGIKQRPKSKAEFIFKSRHLISVVELLEVDYFPNQLLSGDVGFQSFSACYYFTRNILRSANSWSRVARFVQPRKGP